MTLPKNLLFIRHGESQANKLLDQIKNDKATPIKDWDFVPDSQYRLTDLGKEQAAQIGQYLRDESIQIDKYYVSPFKRTKETAALLNLPNAQWRLIRELRERSWGEISNIPMSVYKNAYYRNFLFHHKDPLYWVPVAGESIVQVAEGRIGNFIARLHREDTNNSTLCVTHHDVMMALRIILEHISDDQFIENIEQYSDIPNCCLIHYSRIDPETKQEHSRLKFMRMVIPEKDGTVIGDWIELDKHLYSNQDLLNSL